MTQDEQDVIDLGKSVERLYANKDFQETILGVYIDSQAISLGKSFEGSMDQLDTLKSITHLSTFLISSLDNAKIVQLNNKG